MGVRIALIVWMDELNGVDAVVHLAGANLGANRWNEKFKKLAYDSRIISTRNLVEAIKLVEQKPKVFIYFFCSWIITATDTMKFWMKIVLQEMIFWQHFAKTGKRKHRKLSSME